ncbi:tape measure protein [Borrelia turicatae]|uniref:Phage tape measure domain-containing protein n=1 Tax=Borrelia turicatae (strain 91E135) TaxID=314724 RepID=A0ABF7R099_BORT9|nr:tape measure protein [Borrelia turicatae]ASJ27735.1 phage tape measure domain-containing protein [Borrelia turicatae 91E135]UPA14115.1 tape measure protein [Borrelia turicatae 91E135]
MTLDEIIIPLSITTSNNDKLDTISSALERIAKQEFKNLNDLKSKLESAAKTGANVGTVYDALISQADKMGKNFKKLADSIKGVGDKTKNIKTLRSTFKGLGKSLINVKGLAQGVGEALDRLVSSVLPITLIIKAVEKIGSAISGIFTGSLDAIASFNEEVGVFSNMLGNADVGRALADDMRSFGEETLFTCEAINNAAKTMLSYGATASEVSDRMRMFGEAAGGSSEGLEKLAEVYSKVEANNRIALEDLESLRDAGVDITGILAEEAGVAGESLFEMASEGKLGFEELSGALRKATSEGGKFYKNTAREAKTLADAQLQTSKMSEKLFLELGQALEPLMIGFEKIKQGLLLGIVTPIKNIISSVMDLFGKLKELVSYVGGKFVEGFKVAFDPIIKLFERVSNLASDIWNKMLKILGLSKEDPLKAPFEDKRSEEERLKNQDKIDKDNFNKQMISDYSDLQKQIFKMQREVALKPLEEQEKATRRLESIINAKNKAFIAKYGASFDLLTDENQKTLANVERDVNNFAKANFGFVNEHKDLQNEIARLNREILMLPYEAQEKAMRDLASTINDKQKAFVDKYLTSFKSLNESNKNLLTTLQRGVNEFGKTATDRSFVEAHKALQQKVTSMQFEVMMRPLAEREKASAEMQTEIDKLYHDFAESHKGEFERLNESNRNILLQIVSKTEAVAESLGNNFSLLFDSVIGVVNKIVTEDLGKGVVAGKGADTLTQSLFDVSKDMLASMGPWGAMASAALSFTVGIFKGLEEQRIKEIEERRDKDLEELAKQSEVGLARIEEGFDREIAMRKDKLGELDDQYSKEIEFLKQAQSKGQISGEEFQNRIAQVESEYKTKRQQESGAITGAEESKKIEMERHRKLESLEGERIKAQAEIDKINSYNFYWNRDRDLKRAEGLLDEILNRIAKVRSAGSVQEIKFARKGAHFMTTKPTYIPGAGLMTSEMGQSELIRVTPAPIDENLRNLEARIIAEEINKIQKSEGNGKGQVIINNYNFNGDVLDADKLVRMLKAREHSMSFRMAE